MGKIIEIAEDVFLKKCDAVGRVRLDLTDPLTGKVKERIDAENHVFMDVLTSWQLYSMGSYFGWNTEQAGYAMAGVGLALNDDDTAINTKLALLRGQTIGYGIPSTGSSGLVQGAYNAANQVIADMSDLSKVRWKYQYDFTPSQANGVIKNVGLTQQYSGQFFTPKHGVQKKANFGSGNAGYCNDGRYCYIISSVSVITKYDLWLNSQTTIDVSATVGSNSAEYKCIGYAPRTGKYYVWKYSSTAANRRMYVFSGNTFGTLETTYSPSNIAINNNGYNYPFYVYGNFMYWCATDNTFHKADFVNNVAHTTVTIPSTTHSVLGTSYVNTRPQNGCLADEVGIYILGAMNSNDRGVLWNPDNDSIAAFFRPYMGYGAGGWFFNPLVETRIVSCFTGNNVMYSLFHIGHAVTSLVMSSPFTKTSANGMTATYELEVYW